MRWLIVVLMITGCADTSELETQIEELESELNIQKRTTAAMFRTLDECCHEIDKEDISPQAKWWRPFNRYLAAEGDTSTFSSNVDWIQRHY